MNEDRKNVIYDFSAIKSARKSWITKAEEGPKTTKNQNRMIAAKEGVQRARNIDHSCWARVICSIGCNSH